MDEKKAIEEAISCWEKRVIPPDTRELTETAAIQTVVMLYMKGFELVSAKRELKLGDTVSREELGQMLKDGVIY